MKRLAVCGCIAAVLVAINYSPVWASIAGEENVTLVKILVELMHAKKEMEEINDAAHVTAELTNDFVETYRKVNAGIDELENYSWDKFTADFTNDLYHQYPGIKELKYASKNLRNWENTHTRSPFTAYEAITAVVADVSEPLREDIDEGKTDIDDELILGSEAAGSFAAATTAEEATRGFDDEMKDLARLASTASPGQSEQISARASLLVAAQQSYVIRLLSRTVRLQGVDAVLSYGERLRAKNSQHERKDATAKLAEAALKPPAMIQFAGAW